MSTSTAMVQAQIIALELLQLVSLSPQSTGSKYGQRDLFALYCICIESGTKVVIFSKIWLLNSNNL